MIIPCGGVSVSEHHYHPGIAGGRGEQLRGLGECVRVVGAPTGGQAVHGVLQGVHRSDELRIHRGGLGKADDPDAAAGADLSVLRTVGGFVDDIDKGFGPGLEVDQGASGHAAGTVKNQNDISGMAADVGRSSQRQCDFEGTGTIDLVSADDFVGIVEAHSAVLSFCLLGQGSPASFYAGGRRAVRAQNKENSASGRRRFPMKYPADARQKRPESTEKSR